MKINELMSKTRICESRRDEKLLGKIVLEFPDGYKIILLSDPKILNKHVKYYEFKYDSTQGSFFYGLYDTENQPHGFLEVLDDKVISVISLNHTDPIRREYSWYLVEFIQKLGFTVDPHYLRSLNLIMTANGVIDIDSMQGGSRILGNYHVYDDQILPSNLHIDGDLTIKSKTMTKLPTGLQIKGSLIMQCAKITELPSDIKIGKSLDAQASALTSLPNGLHIPGNLRLDNSQHLTELPHRLSVGGDLHISNTNISEIRPDTKIVGSLWVSYTPIKNLPKGLTVGRNLFLQNSNIINLPVGLHVNGDLNISNTKISSLPKGLYIEDNLDISDSSITELPSDIIVKGSVLYPQFSKLPDDYIYPKGVYSVGRALGPKYREILTHDA